MQEDVYHTRFSGLFCGQSTEIDLNALPRSMHTADKVVQIIEELDLIMAAGQQAGSPLEGWGARRERGRAGRWR